MSPALCSVGLMTCNTSHRTCRPCRLLDNCASSASPGDSLKGSVISNTSPASEMKPWTATWKMCHTSPAATKADNISFACIDKAMSAVPEHPISRRLNGFGLASGIASRQRETIEVCNVPACSPRLRMPAGFQTTAAPSGHCRVVMLQLTSTPRVGSSPPQQPATTWMHFAAATDAATRSPSRPLRSCCNRTISPLFNNLASSTQSPFNVKRPDSNTRFVMAFEESTSLNACRRAKCRNRMPTNSSGTIATSSLPCSAPKLRSPTSPCLASACDACPSP
mmetsp:Transcript_130456/g.418300  ORF Transcript_130456/g.418300 Transcript_130456/m.418300 type:complete len:279 (-) Transcript_130456:1048-1884(-)